MTAEQELAIYRAVFDSRNEVRRISMAKMIFKNGRDPVSRHFNPSMQRTAQRVKEKLSRYGIIDRIANKQHGTNIADAPCTVRTASIYRRDSKSDDYEFSTGPFV